MSLTSQYCVYCHRRVNTVNTVLDEHILSSRTLYTVCARLWQYTQYWLVKDIIHSMYSSMSVYTVLTRQGHLLSQTSTYCVYCHRRVHTVYNVHYTQYVLVKDIIHSMCSSMTVYTVLTRQGHYTQYWLIKDIIHSMYSSMTVYTVLTCQGHYTQYVLV
jgi:hypothetical protein